MTSERERDEVAAIHRSRRAVAEAVAGLQSLGLYERMTDGSGRSVAVQLEPAQRRELLVFLSELGELTKNLERMSTDLARDIARTNNNMTASATYQRTGIALRKHARQGRH